MGIYYAQTNLAKCCSRHIKEWSPLYHFNHFLTCNAWCLFRSKKDEYDVALKCPAYPYVRRPKMVYLWYTMCTTDQHIGCWQCFTHAQIILNFERNTNICVPFSFAKPYILQTTKYRVEIDLVSSVKSCVRSQQNNNTYEIFLAYCWLLGCIVITFEMIISDGSDLVAIILHWKCAWYLMHDTAFQGANQLFYGLIRTLKPQGLDRTVHKSALTQADFKKLYSCGILDTNNPVTLQNKVFVDVDLHFCRRGRKGLRELNKDNFVKKSDSNGRTYITLGCNELEKNHQGFDKRDYQEEPRTYEQGVINVQ